MDYSFFYDAISTLERTVQVQFEAMARLEAIQGKHSVNFFHADNVQLIDEWTKTRGYLMQAQIAVVGMLKNTIRDQRSYKPGTVERVRLIHIRLGMILNRMEEQITSARSCL
jgi:hypothetical protein